MENNTLGELLCRLQDFKRLVSATSTDGVLCTAVCVELEQKESKLSLHAYNLAGLSIWSSMPSGNEKQQQQLMLFRHIANTITAKCTGRFLYSALTWALS